MAHSHDAYFTITGTFNPEEITEAVATKPTKAWNRGDKHPQSPARYRFSRWSLYSRLDRSQCIQTHISDILDHMDENTDGFLHISELYGGVLQVVDHFYRMCPGWSFDKRTILRLAQYSLSPDFDFYAYYAAELDVDLN